MKRPMATVGFTYLAALVSATYFSAEFAKIMAIVFFVLFLVSLAIAPIRRTMVLPISLLTLTFALGMYSSFTYFKVVPIERLDGQDVYVSGRVCEIPYSAYNRYYYVLETDKVDYDGAPQKIKLRMSMSTPLDVDLYDRLSGRVHMFLPTDSGGFSSKSYYAARGIHVSSYLYEYEGCHLEEDPNKPLYYYFLKVKQALIEAVRTILPKEHASVAVGVLLGDKYFMDDDIKSDFKEIGVSHILAVSGLHTSVIAAIVFMLLTATRLSKRWVYLLTCVALLTFMAVTGFSASVSRAGIMLIMFYIGKFFYAKSDSLNSLGFATLLLSIVNPFAAGDTGLLLSVFATLGIILFEGYFEEKIKALFNRINCCSKFTDSIAGMTSVTLCATIATLPIIMLSFGRISLISIVSNILIVMPTMLMMIFTLFAAILYFVPLLNFIVTPLALVSGVLINYITFCADLLAKIPFASVATRQPMILFWFASCCVLFAVALLLYKEYQLLKLSAILSGIVLFVGILSYQIFDRDVTHLAFLDTGTGCSAVISKNGHAAVLACGGDPISSSRVQNYLNNLNVKNLDYILLSDLQDATASYANEVIKKFDPAYVVLQNDGDVLNDKLDHNVADRVNTVYFNDIAKINLWDNVKITAMNLDDHGYVYLSVNDVNMLILPSGGDTKLLNDKYKFYDILAYSGDLENSSLISSSYGVICANLNAASVFANNLAKDHRLPLATAGDGDIVFDFTHSKNISIKRMV